MITRPMATLSVVLLSLLFLGVLSQPAQAAPCPNEALRQAQGSTDLPGCMALEMASPPKKFSQPASMPSFSRDGERMQMVIQTALSGSSGYQYYGGDSYVASRGAGGWEIAPTSPLDPAITAGGRKWGSAAAFTPDLSRWAQTGATQVQYNAGIAQIFSGGLDGSFAPLSPLLIPIDDSGTPDIGAMVQNLQFSGAAADLSSGVVRVTLGSTGYLSGDPRGSTPFPGPGGDTNSYVAFLDKGDEPALELLARDKDGVVYGGRCGAHLGGEGTTFNQGAISPDGDRIFFTTRPAQPFDEEKAEGPVCDIKNGLRVLKRTATPAGSVIEELIPGGPSGAGDDLFQAASADGTKAYLLSPRQLTASDTDSASGPCSGNLGASKGCDLYLYDASKPEGERITQASDGEGPEEADVLNSTTAISGDGSRAYFVAQGVLTSDTNPEGDSAQAGEPNLYLYEAQTDSLSFIATLAAGDAAGMWDTKGTGFGDAYAAPLYGPGLEGGGDGHVLAFASKAPITADDEDAGFRDVFRYDADTETLQCISKAPEGGSDNGSFNASVNPTLFKLFEQNFGEAARWMSEDGETIAFSTAEALLPSDEDGATNPYVWRSGELGAAFAPIDISPVVEPPAVSPVGAEVAFATTAPLLPQDGDTAKDVYVAREGGGFPLPAPPTACDPLQEGSCQQKAPAPQAPPAPASTAFSGPGNASEPVKCRKPLVKRRGKCIKKPRKHKARKRAGKGRGGRR